MLLADLGEQIATGSRSRVFAYGRDAVVKVPIAGVPEGWVRFEGNYTEAVHRAGAPAPKFLGVDELNGREVGVYERISGPSMWERLAERPSEASELGLVLADLHHELFRVPPPLTLPAQQTRLVCKILDASVDNEPVLRPLLERVRFAKPSPVVLCHGDFHPKNILLSERGPIVVDWFDASRGSALIDIARSSLLLCSATGRVGDGFLPGASAKLLNDLEQSYVHRSLELLNASGDVVLSEHDVATWRAVSAAARIAEGIAPAEMLPYCRF